MIKAVIFQNDCPIDHPYCDSNGIMHMPVVPRISEDILLDHKPAKIINVTHMLGAKDYDVRLDIAPTDLG